MTNTNVLAWVAEHLGNGWRLEQCESGLSHCLTDGRHNISVRQSSDRIEFVPRRLASRRKGCPETFPHFSVEAPTISVSLNKGPAVIARDIKRRLLPKLEAWTARAESERDAYERFMDGVDALSNQLRSRLGVKDNGFNRTCFSIHMPGGGWAEVQINSPDSVRFRLDCREEFASRLANLISEMMNEPRGSSGTSAEATHAAGGLGAGGVCPQRPEEVDAASGG